MFSRLDFDVIFQKRESTWNWIVVPQLPARVLLPFPETKKYQISLKRTETKSNTYRGHVFISEISMAIFYICIIKLDISTLRVNFHLILKLQACLLETN